MGTVIKLFLLGCFVYLLITYAIRGVLKPTDSDISDDIPTRFSGKSLLLFFQEYLFTCLHILLLVADYLLTPIIFLSRKSKIPDEHDSQPPIILIHGYMMRGLVLWPMMRYLKRKGITRVFLFTYTPVWGDIPHFAEQLAQEVNDTLARCETDHVDLVAHSMGGLVARYYINSLGGDQYVGRLVTLGTPHNGTVLGALSSFKSGAQMRPESQFLTRLAENDNRLEAVKVCSIYSDFDQIIIPEDSPILEGKNVINRKIPDLGHAGLVYSRRVYIEIIEILKRPG